MKVSPNNDFKLNIRLTKNDYDLLRYSAKSVGLTVSKLLRMYIDSTITPIKAKLRSGELKHEDIESLLNCKL